MKNRDFVGFHGILFSMCSGVLQDLMGCCGFSRGFMMFFEMKNQNRVMGHGYSLGKNWDLFSMVTIGREKASDSWVGVENDPGEHVYSWNHG